MEPEIVVEVAFTEWTSNGRLRYPRSLGLRRDKDPREAVRASYLELARYLRQEERYATLPVIFLAAKAEPHRTHGVWTRKCRGSRKRSWI